MARSDVILPQWVDLSKEHPPVAFMCDQHGERSMVLRFNGDNARVRCADCLEETIPNRVRSIDGVPQVAVK